MQSSPLWHEKYTDLWPSVELHCIFVYLEKDYDRAWSEELEEGLKRWRYVLEKRAISRDRIHVYEWEGGKVNMQEAEIVKTDGFKYLHSTFQSKEQ